MYFPDAGYIQFCICTWKPEKWCSCLCWVYAGILWGMCSGRNAQKGFLEEMMFEQVFIKASGTLRGKVYVRQSDEHVH